MPALAPNLASGGDPVSKRLFTVDEYYRMAEAGILGEDDRVELIEGEIVQITPIGSYHAGCVMRLHNQFLSLECHNKAFISMQNPIHLNNLSEPQPDIMLLILREDFYDKAHPTPQDVFLIVEVADFSQEHDRRKKIPLYGRSGVKEAWLVDLQKRSIDIYTQPSPTGYKSTQTFVPGDSMSPSAFSELTIAVEDILGINPPIPQ
jgi:Uma2 family endonuclease